MQNIILFGGKGYLGQELSHQLIRDEHNIFVVDKTEGDFIGDVTNGKFIEDIFRILDREGLHNLSLVYLIGNSLNFLLPSWRSTTLITSASLSKIAST
jgi:nucleoside-diphosphate-sugar epimerase